MRTIDGVAGAVRIIDQAALPGTERWLDLSTVDELIDAIARLAVRGALGVALAARTPASCDVSVARRVSRPAA